MQRSEKSDSSLGADADDGGVLVGRESCGAVLAEGGFGAPYRLAPIFLAARQGRR